MGDLKLLLLIVLPAIVAACIVGVAFGKHQIKKASGQLRPLLTPKQRIAYSVSVVVGVACLLVGFLYNPVPEGMDGMGEDMYGETGLMEGDMGLIEGEMGFPKDGMGMMEDGGDPALNTALPEGDLPEDDLPANPEGDSLEGDTTDGAEDAAPEEGDDAEAQDEANTGSTTGGTTGGTAQAAPAPSIRGRGSVRIDGGGGGSVVVVG